MKTRSNKDNHYMDSDPALIWRTCVLVQKTKTKVVKGNCNPVWNDELTLTMRDPKAPIHIVSTPTFWKLNLNTKLPTLTKIQLPKVISLLLTYRNSPITIAMHLILTIPYTLPPQPPLCHPQLHFTFSFSFETTSPRYILFTVNMLNCLFIKKKNNFKYK